MHQSISLTSLAISLFLSGAACASSRGAAYIEPDGGQLPAVQSQGTLQTQKFVTVEGADLKSKLEAAGQRARSAATRTPYWSAYAFDVRPGVAVDPGGLEFHGSMDTVGGTHVFIGTSNGMTVETRDLGIFLLRDPSGGAVKRMEIYNLRREREYGGYPVYWLGRAGNEESLNYLRGFAETNQESLAQERATLAVALHDDARVAGVLKNFFRTSPSMKVRSTSIYWLGQLGGEIEFLAEVVRNEREQPDVRKRAAHAIGASRDQSALDTLQSLYASVPQREVKRGIIHAVADNENRAASYAFLLKVAKSDPDREARKLAVHQLGEVGRDGSAVEDLMKIYAAEQDSEVKKRAIHALSEIKDARAEAKLFEIARGGDPPELRRHAIHRLAETDTEARVDQLIKLYDAERDAEVKRQILHAFSEMQSPRAQAKFLAVARDAQEQPDVRRQAIHRLGERDSEATVDELMKIFQSDHNEDVRRQIIHAFSEMDNARAENHLFEIARRGDQLEVRRQAIHRLGEKAGQRSLELLRDVTSDQNENTEVQKQAVRALGEKPAEQSVPLLIQIAKTHPSPEVRKTAIRILGESGDPRAVEFFKEVLTK